MPDVNLYSSDLQVTPVLGVAGLYASGDAVGALFTITNAARIRSQTHYPGGQILDVMLRNKTTSPFDVDLLLFKENPSGSTFTDNSAVNIVDADISKVIAHVELRKHITFSANSISYERNVGVSYFTKQDCTLYGLLIARATPTLAAGDLSLKIGVLQD